MSNEANRGFIECHMDIWNESDPAYFKAKADKKDKPKYAFCECTHHHIVGFIVQEKFYFSDISEVKIMFPTGHYEEWCERFWLNNYKEAFELQTKLNYARASQAI